MSISDSLFDLSSEAGELYLRQNVTELVSPPTPLEFYRNFVAPNLPVIIRGGVKHWPAVKKWSNEYLREQIGEKSVTVAVTPNGYADAPFGKYFVLPEERLMLFKDMLNVMEAPKDYNGVFYAQKQNSSFLEEFADLLPDAASEIPWATKAFNKTPDAVNFWIGDKRAVTSMHKDPYENLYAVVRGSKTFTLHPPTDLPCIPHKMYPTACYKEDSNGVFNILKPGTNEVLICNVECYRKNSSLLSTQNVLTNHARASVMDQDSCLNKGGERSGKDNCSDSIRTASSNRNGNMNFDTNIDRDLPPVECTKFIDEDALEPSSVKDSSPRCSTEDPSFDLVPWICIDPLQPDYMTYPSYKNAHKIQCTVRAGDLLYLPSLWFHHVTHEHSTIAVNFWYDMEYDIRYNYYRFVENVMKAKSFT